MSSRDLVVVGNTSDDPFAIDVAFAMGQVDDIADLISLKTFANSEFCPRFISDESDFTRIGTHLEGRTVMIVSTSNRVVSRQNLAMRNMLIARSAKENGAAEVMLVEPDLFYSAQDRGPIEDHSTGDETRDPADRKKFDGQPFTAQLYAQMLKLAGVDRVLTVHNHSASVQSIFGEVFEGNFHNLIPYDIYAHYLQNSSIIGASDTGEGLALCAPDKGARDFVKEMFRRLDMPDAKFVLLDKERTGERDVEIKLHDESESTFAELEGHDVVLFDDMVRTGSTVVKSCEFLRRIKPRKTVFAVSHFYSSAEGREKLASASIDEILTLNTIPTILNRDEQGRLRKKLVVLKLEAWLAKAACAMLDVPLDAAEDPNLYQIDMSSKNPRFIHKIWGSGELAGLQGAPLPR